MTQLVHMVVTRIVNKPEKRYCKYVLGHECVYAIRQKTGKIEVFISILN